MLLQGQYFGAFLCERKRSGMPGLDDRDRNLLARRERWCLNWCCLADIGMQGRVLVSSGNNRKTFNLAYSFEI